MKTAQEEAGELYPIPQKSIWENPKSGISYTSKEVAERERAAFIAGAEYALTLASEGQREAVERIFSKACDIFSDCVSPEGPCGFDSARFQELRAAYLNSLFPTAKGEAI